MTKTPRNTEDGLTKGKWEGMKMGRKGISELAEEAKRWEQRQERKEETEERITVRRKRGEETRTEEGEGVEGLTTEREKRKKKEQQKNKKIQMKKQQRKKETTA